MEGEFFLDSLLESCALLECEGIGFGDDRNNIDHVGELLEDDNVDWFEAEDI